MLMIQDVLIEAMISSFCESMYLSYFRFQSNAWQNEGDIFTHKSHNEEGQQSDSLLPDSMARR